MIERHVARLGPAVVLAGLMTWLLVRLIPDVSGKPLHEDEAVAGLVSARPLGDVLQTVVIDRGGAPLHFLLAHVALALDPSADALRWLSVVFALATVPVCYDLARRLAGPFAGIAAAALAATSQLLVIYGTFGRMYSLLAFVSALAADLFVRALDRPTRATTTVAAAASLLPLAVHPFGVFLVAAEAAVALWLWRGRPLVPALPALAIGVLAVPLLAADLRLSDRYGAETAADPISASSAATAGLHALGGAAGGVGPTLALFAALAAVGAYVLGRQRPAFAAFALLAVSAPPAVLAAAGALGAVSDHLSPRHLVFALPVWIALVAVGLTRVATALPRPAALAVIAAVAVAAVAAHSAVAEPRTIPTGTHRALAPAAAWLRTNIGPGDVLYPYSPVFLAALPTARNSAGYPREAVALARAARRTRAAVPKVLVSIPLRTGLSWADVKELRAPGLRVHLFRAWLLLEADGPFSDGRSTLTAIVGLLGNAEASVGARSLRVHAYVDQIRGAACGALTRLGGTPLACGASSSSSRPGFPGTL